MNEPVDRPQNLESMTVEVEPNPVEPDVDTEVKVGVEEFHISGDDLVGKVKELIHQGNIRRIIIKAEDDRTLIEIPLTVGVVGGAIAATMFPVVAAVGAIGALVAKLKLVIERRE
ncbi:MAG TPA: hypothetical protein DCL61_16950 [Cyanobacteria bacterium UBA12227]|nr:hypothetical protein [Cyanobacteria bacterium UBA12227]HAX87900.1 hypothetical protein [Cyanobacteria bacterium UBA11370]HBY76966.1 hypothetical protein [Cyanobacteria bacterium UBA11148]